MAGDWIKMRVDLPLDPSVICIADSLGLDSDSVIGKLFRVWAWADAHASDGVAKVGPAWVDRYTSCTGFASAMELAGWLVVRLDGITFPNFDRHNGKSAKIRLENQRRQRQQRALSRSECDRTVTEARQKCDASSLLSSSLLSSGGGVGGSSLDGGSGGKADPEQVAWFRRRPDWVPEGKPWLDREACERLASLGLTTEQVREVMREAKDKRNVLKNPAGYVLKKLSRIVGTQSTPKPKNAAQSIVGQMKAVR